MCVLMFFFISILFKDSSRILQHKQKQIINEWKNILKRFSSFLFAVKFYFLFSILRKQHNSLFVSSLLNEKLFFPEKKYQIKLQFVFCFVLETGERKYLIFSSLN